MAADIGIYCVGGSVTAGGGLRERFSDCDSRRSDPRPGRQAKDRL